MGLWIALALVVFAAIFLPWWAFIGAVIVLLVVLARRNGAFGQRQHGDLDGSGAFAQVSPRTAGVQIRDPRAQVDTGDRLGRR